MAAVACASLLAVYGVAGPSTTGAAVGEKPVVLEESSASAHPFVWANTGSFAGANYNYFGSSYLGPTDLLLLPLAEPTAGGLDTLIPEVASSWKLAGRQLTVDVRPHMLWQNHTPVTTKDVLDSVILAGVDGNALWDNVSAVSAAGSGKVKFTIVPGASPKVVENIILSMYVVPASQYGQFVTPGLLKTVETYYQLLRTNPNAASKSSASKAIQGVLTKVIDYKPSTLLADGPFRLKSFTTSTELMVKSPTFFDAKKIHVTRMIWEGITDADNEAGVTSGNGSITMDLAGLPYAIYAKAMHVNGEQIHFAGSFGQQAMAFNNRKYPFSLKAVRQAIAYVVHRPALITLGGDKLAYKYVPRPDLVYGPTQFRYLTKAQLDSLNPYNYNPSKAASLLESVGFKKVNGTWMMPNGKPFKTTIISPNFTDDEFVYKTFADWLTAFGIPTQEDVLDSTTSDADEVNGDFEMISEYSAVLDPLQLIDGLLGSANNFVTSGPNHGQPGLGFGPVMNVPGLGKVNVPATLDHEAYGAAPGKQMKKLTFDWARLVNQQLPVLSWGDRTHPIAVSTVEFKDWPKSSSVLWADIGTYESGGLLDMLEAGYVRPR